MDLAKSSNKARHFTYRFVLYLSCAVLILGPFLVAYKTAAEAEQVNNFCFNHKALCAPILLNNIELILNYFEFEYVFFFLSFTPLFVLFILFWLRMERFHERQSIKKVFAYLVLIINPFTLAVLSRPSANSYHLLFFILASLGYETINHGMIVRGLIVSSTSIAMLALSGGVGILLSVVLTSFFYIAVKWHVLKKYALTSYTLLLFPTIGLLVGTYYLTQLYNASFTQALINDNIRDLDISALFNWIIFLPLFFMYRIKDKKGLNIIKKYIVVIFFVTEISFLFLRVDYTQANLLGMCALCVCFEMISDTKFSKTHTGHIILFGILSWCYYLNIYSFLN